MMILFYNHYKNQVNYLCFFLIQHFVILIVFFAVTVEHYMGAEEKLLKSTSLLYMAHL